MWRRGAHPGLKDGGRHARTDNYLEQRLTRFGRSGGEAWREGSPLQPLSGWGRQSRDTRQTGNRAPASKIQEERGCDGGSEATQMELRRGCLIRDPAGSFGWTGNQLAAESQWRKRDDHNFHWKRRDPPDLGSVSVREYFRGQIAGLLQWRHDR